MNVSSIHSKEATGIGQSVTEAVASTSNSSSTSAANVKDTPAVVSTSVDPIRIESAPKKEDDIEILEETESEHFLIDLTTLLPKEDDEKDITEDDICITKVVHTTSPLAEYMMKHKKNKSSKRDAERVTPSSSEKTPDISLKDLISCSRKHDETTSKSWRSEKRRYSRLSDTLSEKQCNENVVGTDENLNLGLCNRSDSPPKMTRFDKFSLSPTYKRKTRPFTECFKDYRAGSYQKPTYSEAAMQPAEKRKRSPSDDEPVVVIDVSSSSSAENSPCTSRKKHKKTLTRKWEWSEFGLEYRKKRNEYPGVELSIMSYNLLAQDLLEDHPHLYTYCKWEVLLWEYRRARLLEEIDEHLPDIMCFQEVQNNHYEDFLKPKLEKRGYLGIYCKKSGSQSDGCATFFKVMKFDLLNFRQVFYQKGGVLDRANVGLIVSLKPKTSIPNLDSSELYIANTHLLFNPRRGDVKLAQLILLFAELDKAAYKCHLNSNTIIYHPTIVCGDFNFEPYCRIYKLIISRYLHYEGLLVREMAGTSESDYGRDYYLPKDFFPSYLYITNSCQFAEAVKERNLKEASKLLRESSPLADQLENTTEKPSNAEETENSREASSPAPPGLEEILAPLGSGEISHFFNFVSTYKHVTNDKRYCKVEVTSYHNRTCATTDYIFYNVDKKVEHSKKSRGHSGGTSVTEGRLKLLRRYGLFSTEEVRKMDRLPNAELGSDHFSLLAHFLLT